MRWTTKTFERRTALVAVMVLGSALGAIAGTASGQVLEIGDTGAVVVHDRPEVTSSTGAVPILTLPPRQAQHLQLATPPGLVGAAAHAALSPALVEAVARQESAMRAGVVSAKGAIGEMQLMPGTARGLGVDPFDTDQNLKGGAAYLAGLLKRYDGDVVLALAAYNAGPAAVDLYGGVPPFKETRAYVAAILDRLSRRVALDTGR